LFSTTQGIVCRVTKVSGKFNIDRKIIDQGWARAGGVARIFNDLCLEQG
jgi:hypothetical protein